MYIWGAIFTISYSNLSCSAIFMSSSIYVLRKEPAMLHIITSRPSFALIDAVIGTDLVDTVREVASPGTAFFIVSGHPHLFDPSLSLLS